MPKQAEVRAPAAVRAINLVDAVWPPGEEPRPEARLPLPSFRASSVHLTTLELCIYRVAAPRAWLMQGMHHAQNMLASRR